MIMNNKEKSLDTAIYDCIFNFSITYMISYTKKDLFVFGRREELRDIEKCVYVCCTDMGGCIIFWKLVAPHLDLFTFFIITLRGTTCNDIRNMRFMFENFHYLILCFTDSIHYNFTALHISLFLFLRKKKYVSCNEICFRILFK